MKLFLILLSAVSLLCLTGCDRTFRTEASNSVTLDAIPNSAQAVTTEIHRKDGSRDSVTVLNIRDENAHIVSSSSIGSSQQSLWEDFVSMTSSAVHNVIGDTILSGGLKHAGTNVTATGGNTSSTATSSSGP